MFKNTILVVIAFLFTITVNAQIKPRTFEFGPKIGANINALAQYDTNTVDKKLSFLYQGGIFTRLNFGKFSLQPEFIYQLKGATFKTPSSKYTFKYLSTPVLLGYTPIKGVYLETGPEISWALNKNYSPEGLTVYGPNAKMDNAWIFGTRINMLDLFSLVSMNIRYTQGLTNQTTRKIGTTPLDLRNRTVQLSFTYTFSEYWLWKKKYGQKK